LQQLCCHNSKSSNDEVSSKQDKSKSEAVEADEVMRERRESADWLSRMKEEEIPKDAILQSCERDDEEADEGDAEDSHKDCRSDQLPLRAFHQRVNKN
jgi:hypothetical protein